MNRAKDFSLSADCHKAIMYRAKDILLPADGHTAIINRAIDSSLPGCHEQSQGQLNASRWQQAVIFKANIATCSKQMDKGFGKQRSSYYQEV